MEHGAPGDGEVETLTDLQEIAWALAAAESVKERRALYELLRATETEVDSSEELEPVVAA